MSTTIVARELYQRPLYLSAGPAKQRAASPAGRSLLLDKQGLSRRPYRPIHEEELYRLPTLTSDPVGYVQSLWLLYSTTMGVSVLEPWESVLFHALFATILYFIYWTAVAYLPSNLRFLAARTRYYVLGEAASI